MKECLRLVKLKGLGRKRSWPVSRYSLGILLKGLRKTTKVSVGVLAEIQRFR
jgi:hypothetical protein